MLGPSEARMPKPSVHGCIHRVFPGAVPANKITGIDSQAKLVRDVELSV